MAGSHKRKKNGFSKIQFFKIYVMCSSSNTSVKNHGLLKARVTKGRELYKNFLT